MKNVKSLSGGWTLTLILLGTLGAYGFLIFVPTQRSLGRLREELEAQREYTAQAELEFASYQPLDQEFQEVSAFVQQWREVAPGEGDLPGLLGTISQFAMDAGVTLRRMNPSASVDLTTIGQDTFQFQIDGNFKQLFDFLHHLERCDAIVWFNDLQMKQSSDDSDGLQCQLDLTVFSDNRDTSD